MTKCIVSNVTIAKMIANKGFDYEKALLYIDQARTPDDEKKPITREELGEMLYNITLGFLIEMEEAEI